MMKFLLQLFSESGGPSFSLVQGLLRSIPGLPMAALAGVVILFFAWSCERQAGRRATVEARQVKKQAAEKISQLQQQAAFALRDAKRSAEAVRGLEAQRQQLAREAEGLRQSLASLRKQELARVDEVATLSASEVLNRVASRLQEQVSGQHEEQVSGARCQVSGQRSAGLQARTGVLLPSQGLDPLTRPTLAEESASAGHPLPHGGEGYKFQGPQGGEGYQSHILRAGEGPEFPVPEFPPLVPNPDSPSSPALAFSDQGLRKIETSLIELDSCRQQSQVMGEQVSNCEQQSKLNSSIIDQQSGTIAKLNTALADKDQILAQSQVAHRAELQAVRGTFRSHLFRALEYFAGGFIAGVLVR